MTDSTASGYVLSGSATGTAGTAKQVVTGTQRVGAITIVAKDNNGSRIYVGGSDITQTANRGLAAGDSVKFQAPRGIDPSSIYFITDVTGEGVDFYIVKVS